MSQKKEKPIKELRADEIIQSGFDRTNFVKSGGKNKWIFPVSLFTMFVILYIVFMVSSNLILKKNNYLPSDNVFLFFSPVEIFQIIKQLWYVNPVLKLELVMFFVTPFAVVFLFTGLVLRAAQNTMKSSKPTGMRHGSARFDTDEEVLRAGIDPTNPESRSIVVEDLGAFFREGRSGVSLGKAVLKDKKGKTKEVYLIEQSANEHILCYAPSRSGKGVGLVIPSLLLWRDSSITLDPKGENWDLTSGFLRDNGHRCIRLDLGAPYFRYNPLSELNPTSIDLPDEVRRMVGVITGGGKGGGDNKFFEDQAKDLLTGCLTYLIVTYHNPREEDLDLIEQIKVNKPNITLYDLAVYLSGIDPRTGVPFEGLPETEDSEAVSALAQQYEQLANYQKEYTHHNYDPLQKDSYQQVGEFIESTGRKFLQMAIQSEKTFSNIVSSADQNLAVFKLPIVKSVTSNSDFKLIDLVDVHANNGNPTSLYVVNPPKDELTGKTDGVIKIILQNLFISVLYETGLRTRVKNDPNNKYGWTKRSVLCMLDEFPKLGKFEIMEKLLADAAGYGAKFYLIAQSDKQINQAYEKENSIFAGTQHKVIFRPADQDTAKVLSEMLGNYTYVEEVFNVNDSGNKGIDIIKDKSGSKNWSESQRSLMTPDEIMSMKDDHAIILSKSHKIYGRKLKWFLDKDLKQWGIIPATVLEPKMVGDNEEIFMAKLRAKGMIDQDFIKAQEYQNKRAARMALKNNIPVLNEVVVSERNYPAQNKQ